MTIDEAKAIKEMDLDIPQHFTKEQSDWIKAYCIRRNIEFYNKAIDDFVKEFKRKTPMENKLVEEIAEQLKAGGENE